MNKKGFTLIELLAVIVILGLLSAIAAVSYNAILNNTKMKSYKSYENTMKDAATRYYEKYSNMPNILGYKVFTISEMHDKEIINPIKDPFANDSTTTCVDNSYTLMVRCENPISEYESSGYNILYISCLKCSSGYETKFEYRKKELNIGANNEGANVCTLTPQSITSSQIKNICSNKKYIENN